MGGGGPALQSMRDRDRNETCSWYSIAPTAATLQSSSKQITLYIRRHLLASAVDSLFVCCYAERRDEYFERESGLFQNLL